MSESTWSAEGEPPPKKRKLPAWLWWCGGGCLLAVILVALLGVWAVGKAKEMMDPERQWEAIAKIQPYDERPLDWQPVFGIPLGGAAFYVLSAPDDTVALLMRFEGKDAEDARKALLDESFSGSFMGLGGRQDMQKGTLEVQGRELPVLRFYQGKGSGPGRDQEGQAALVETTPEGRPAELVIWQFIRAHGDPGKGAFTDEELRTLLEPFDVAGSGR
jgi:hypothetical protein